MPTIFKGLISFFPTRNGEIHVKPLSILDGDYQTAAAAEEEPSPSKTRGPCMCMLDLAGGELIFFGLADVGLWSGVVMKTVLITQGCFCCC